MFTGIINCVLTCLVSNSISKGVNNSLPTLVEFGHSQQGLGIGDYTYTNNLDISALYHLIKSISIELRGDNGVSLYINGNYIAYNHNGSYEGLAGGGSATYLTINNLFHFGNNNITVIVHEDDIVSSGNWTSYSVKINYNY